MSYPIVTIGGLFDDFPPMPPIPPGWVPPGTAPIPGMPPPPVPVPPSSPSSTEETWRETARLAQRSGLMYGAIAGLLVGMGLYAFGIVKR